MKQLSRYFFIAIIGVLSLSACTGDKGSEDKADSVTIDTNITPTQPATSPSDTTLIDSLQTDTTTKP